MTPALLELSLTMAGFTTQADPADDGHHLIYDAAGQKVGDFVVRGNDLHHFEVWGRVRDWWPHSESQAHYRDRVHDLIRRVTK